MVNTNRVDTRRLQRIASGEPDPSDVAAAKESLERELRVAGKAGTVGEEELYERAEAAAREGRDMPTPRDAEVLHPATETYKGNVRPYTAVNEGTSDHLDE